MEKCLMIILFENFLTNLFASLFFHPIRFKAEVLDESIAAKQAVDQKFNTYYEDLKTMLQVNERFCGTIRLSFLDTRCIIHRLFI